MKSEKIGEITPYSMEGYLILALDMNWIKKFEGNQKFEVWINDKRLVICSPIIRRN